MNELKVLQKKHEFILKYHIELIDLKKKRKALNQEIKDLEFKLSNLIIRDIEDEPNLFSDLEE